MTWDVLDKTGLVPVDRLNVNTLGDSNDRNKSATDSQNK